MSSADKKRSSIDDDADFQHSYPASTIGTSYRASNSYPSSSASRQSAPRQRYYPPPAPLNLNHSREARSDSPPASAYFASFPNAGHGVDPIARTKDVGSHFAYSTTLRRHHDENSLISPKMFHHHGGGHRNDEDEPGMLEKVVKAIGAESFAEKLGIGSGSNERGHEMEAGIGDVRAKIGASTEDTPGARFASMSTEDTLAYFHTDPSAGLSSSVIHTLRTTYGYNEFSVDPPSSLIVKFIETIYESPLNLLLLGSAAVSAVMGNIDDAVSITIAILIVLTVGFVQERRSEKSLEALNKLVPHHAHLLRDGSQSTVLANELLPGDVVTFSVGDRIPADIRLLSALDLDLDESSLTGEAHAIRKNDEPCRPGVALGERTSMGFMGTLVRNGRGKGIVVATGQQTEFGVVFTMMQSIEEKRTPLQNSMDELAQKLSALSFGVIGVIVLIGVLQSRSWLEMFTIGVSLAVAAIPEGLPIVTTVTLALGVLRMARRKAIVKKLPSVEALGSVSVICSDKTGTLTKNEQTVTEIFVVDELVVLDSASSKSNPSFSPAVLKTVQIGSICNNAFRNEEGFNVGQSTDVALLNVLDVVGMAPQKPTFSVLSERPFNSELKSMAVSGTHTSSSSPTDSSHQMYYIKGALEAILPRCKSYYVSDDSAPQLDTLTTSLITSKATAVSSRGLRVVAMAYGYGSVESIENRWTSGSAPPELIFAGFQAMMDPPRKGVSDAIAHLHEGGVKVVMITGDAVETALAIGRQLGLLVGSLSQQKTQARGYSNGHSPTDSISSPGVTAAMRGVLTGKDIDAMDDRMLIERVGGVSIFARTTPRHKMRIVGALQARGAVVAMTGDGVNDAPALKMANIGVAMGSGTDVAKEAADVILVDDNFGTILAAVEEGKSIFHNIQHFLAFQLSTAVAALTLITLSTMFKLSNPLNAMQILFINILMDGPPSQSLGVDPADRAVMRRPPRAKDAPIITKRVLGRVLFSASVIVLLTLFVYIHELSDGRMSKRDQTMTFTCFVFLDLASALQNRGLGCAISANKMLLTTVGTSFIVQLSLIYVPFLQAVFQTEALAFRDLFTLLCLGGISISLHEVRRRWERKKDKEGGWDPAGSIA